MMEINVSEYEFSFVEETNEQYEDEYKEYLKTFKYSNKDRYDILSESLGNLNDWIWVGGINYTGYTPDTFYRGLEYFNEYFNNKKEHPEETGECECGHEIVENCWIYNEKKDKFAVVGNCCIKRMFGNEYQKNGKTKKCKNCKACHKNKKTIYCNECRHKKFCKDCNKDITGCYFCPDCKNKSCIKCGVPVKEYVYCYKCFSESTI